MKKHLILIAMMTLGGCSHTNVSGQWDCPAQTGYKCMNITQADGTSAKHISNSDEPQISKTDLKSPNNNAQYHEVWLAPYYDRDGNYHAEHFIYYKRDE